MGIRSLGLVPMMQFPYEPAEAHIMVLFSFVGFHCIVFHLHKKENLPDSFLVSGKLEWLLLELRPVHWQSLLRSIYWSPVFKSPIYGIKWYFCRFG